MKTGLMLASIDEILSFTGEKFQSFPAWIELNPDRCTSGYNRRNTLRPVEVLFFDDDSCAQKLITSHGNFSIRSYGQFWRLWYANGRILPDVTLPWDCN